MSIFRSKALKRTAIAVCVVLALILISLVCFFIYASDYYRADESAIAAFSCGVETVQKEIDEGVLAFEAEGATVGFIFYPGGKVEYTAYVPLMKAVAAKGVLCVLVEMPFNLAVLDIDAADEVMAKYPEIERWYIGGHSLGGSMAASYAEENAKKLEGLVLLGAYSSADVSDKGLSVLSVYGSEDGVMNREKYDGYRKNLPEGFSETVIDGANHAGFGMYGKQEGDGKATLSNEEQILLTADAVTEFINKKTS